MLGHRFKRVNEETMQWAEAQARFYQVLTNPRRVLILSALSRSELSVGEIAVQVGATLQNTSQHLRLMKDRGIIDSRRDGQTVYYWICDRSWLRLIDLGMTK